MTQDQPPTVPTDPVTLELMLTQLRLPTMKQLWRPFGKRADTEGWPAARLLAALAEHELAERARRRIERHLHDARLLPLKTLANFEFAMDSAGQTLEPLGGYIAKCWLPAAMRKRKGRGDLRRPGLPGRLPANSRQARWVPVTGWGWRTSRYRLCPYM